MRCYPPQHKNLLQLTIGQLPRSVADRRPRSTARSHCRSSMRLGAVLRLLENYQSPPALMIAMQSGVYQVARRHGFNNMRTVGKLFSPLCLVPFHLQGEMDLEFQHRPKGSDPRLCKYSIKRPQTYSSHSGYGARRLKRISCCGGDCQWPLHATHPRSYWDI